MIKGSCRELAYIQVEDSSLSHCQVEGDVAFTVQDWHEAIHLVSNEKTNSKREDKISKENKSNTMTKAPRTKQAHQTYNNLHIF